MRFHDCFEDKENVYILMELCSSQVAAPLEVSRTCSLTRTFKHALVVLFVLTSQGPRLSICVCERARQRTRE